MRFHWPRLFLWAGALAAVSATSITAQEKQVIPQIQPVVPLKPEALYQGWRSAKLIGQDVFSKDGNTLGSVRNIIIDDNGRIQAVIVHATNEETRQDFAYRIPWHSIERRKIPARVVADVSDPRQPAHGMFSDDDTVDKKDEFRLTEILGEYARLQTGLAYGLVTDVVFTDQGGMLAVLVTRDARGGGGTFAFGFPGTTGRWSPRLSYYGLPYITPEDATAAGLRVDPRRFGAASAG